MDLVPVLRPLALMGRLPGVRARSQPAYDLVAAHRHELGRCSVPGACRYTPRLLHGAGRIERTHQHLSTHGSRRDRTMYARPWSTCGRVIRATAPDAIESISYQVPTFSDGGFLASFGATKDRCSFYVRSLAVMEAHRAELSSCSTSGGTVHFTPNAPLPDDLVRTLVQGTHGGEPGATQRSKA